MPKYKEYVELMLANNKEAFEAFKKVHDEYGLNPDKFQEKLNREGASVVRLVHDWQDKLCNHSEGSGYGAYSGNLAEKFMNEVRKHFPHLDAVGIKVFTLKKINPK